MPLKGGTGEVEKTLEKGGTREVGKTLENYWNMSCERLLPFGAKSHRNFMVEAYFCFLESKMKTSFESDRNYR